MITLSETKQKIEVEPRWWCIHLMNFVDDFRRHKNVRAVKDPFVSADERIDALLASTAESLCDELGLEPPVWLERIPEFHIPPGETPRTSSGPVNGVLYLPLAW